MRARQDHVQQIVRQPGAKGQCTHNRRRDYGGPKECRSSILQLARIIEKGVLFVGFFFSKGARKSLSINELCERFPAEEASAFVL